MYRFEMRDPADPWGGRQPKFEKLVHRGRNRFEMVGRLHSGKRIVVRLSRFADRNANPS
jgi:hypothetical protein